MIWSFPSNAVDCRSLTFSVIMSANAQGDAYALALYPSGEYLLSGGFDRHVAVTDVQTLQTLKVCCHNIPPLDRIC